MNNLDPLSLLIKDKKSNIDTRFIKEDSNFDMTTPTIGLTDDFFLNIYNVDPNNLDTLDNFIKNNKDNIFLIRRILNVWIHINLINNNMNIKKYNDYITTIYMDIFKIDNKHLNKINKELNRILYNIDINDYDFRIDKELNKFINNNLNNNK